MRQIFSVRFFAAVGAVVGLFFLLLTIFVTRDGVDGDALDDGSAPAVELHRIDFVDRVVASSNPAFRIGFGGSAINETELVIDASRVVRIVPETPGEDHCPELGETGGCALVADLLGEAVVWFALVPMGSGATVELPAIDTLEDGLATLVNGWQFPYAPVLDRRCVDEEFASYRELRDELGDDFTAIYDIGERRLTAVQCRTRVPYAPLPDESLPDESLPDESLPDESLPEE